MIAVPDLFALIVVIPLTLEVLRRLPSAVRNAKGRALWVFILVMDVVMASRITAFADLIEDITGAHDLVILIKRILGFLGVAVLINLISTLVPGRMDGQREPRYRRAISNRPRRIATGVAFIASIALFPLSVRGQGRPEEFLFMQAGHLWGSLHLILFYAYLGFGTICGSMMFGAASRDPKSTGTFKLAMLAMSIGCSIGAIYAILRTGYLVTRLCGKPFLGGDVFVDVTSNFVLTGFVLLVLAGSTAPMWERMSARMDMHAAVNDLRPMWTILTSAVPAVVYRSRKGQWVMRVLEPRAPRLVGALCRAYRAAADLWNWAGLDNRLNRRVTEICDAAIRLRPYLPDGLPEEATETAKELGLPDHATPAYLMYTAMRLKKNGSKPNNETSDCPILKPADDPLTTTAMFLPVGKALASPVLMGKFTRRIRESV